MKMNLIYGIALSGLLMFSCQNESGESADAKMEDTSANMDMDAHDMDNNDMPAGQERIAEKGGIILSYFQKTPDFPSAGLDLVNPKDGSMQKSGEVKFSYKVSSFELAKPTEGEQECHCNVSDKGQHIHNILNNEPYTAHYEPDFSKKLDDGHYVNLSFLSRSFHESIKHRSAYSLSQFTVGNVKAEKMDLTKPVMFYSRPKGEYKGKDAKNILLDFYLVNTELSENGLRVRATINGNEFILTKWAAYALQGLPMGETTIKLELIDKDGNLVPGKFNNVQRKITLSE